MGCGISKFDPEEAGGRPAPPFKRLPKRNVTANVVVSEKLIENTIKDEEADHFVTRQGRKSVSSSPVAAKGNGCVGSDQDIHGLNGQRRFGKLDDDCRVSTAKAMTGEDNEAGNHEGGEESFHEDDYMFCRGSPSFREYCVDCGSSEGQNEGSNNAEEENDSPGERPSNCEKACAETQERSLNSEKVHPASQERSKSSAGTKKKSSRKGFRNAIHRPAGWIGKSKK